MVESLFFKFKGHQINVKMECVSVFCKYFFFLFYLLFDNDDDKMCH